MGLCEAVYFTTHLRRGDHWSCAVAEVKISENIRPLTCSAGALPEGEPNLFASHFVIDGNPKPPSEREGDRIAVEGACEIMRADFLNAKEPLHRTLLQSRLAVTAPSRREP